MIPNDRNLPNLAHDLVRIHKVITRGLSVGVTRGREFLGDGFPSQDLKSGFADYIRSLVSVVAAITWGKTQSPSRRLKKDSLTHRTDVWLPTTKRSRRH